MKKITTLLMTLMLVLTATVANAAEYSVYFDNSASNWSKVNVYGWNGVDFGGWPGTAVTEKTSEGYYKVTVTADADPSTLGAKIIFNNGSAQTGDLAWVTNGIYNKNGNTGNLYGGGSVEMYEFNVYFDNSTANWSKVNVYGWNGVNFGGWPGSEITEKTAEGYYKVTVKDTQSPAGANIIFNDGSAQTSDLVWQDNAVYNQNGFSHTYGETPEIPSTETLTYNVTVPAGTPACYIAGEMNSWGFTAMTMVDETHYTITFDNVTRAMKYKYTASESWDNVEMQADGVTDVLDRTYSENDVVDAWKGLVASYEENIVRGVMYYMHPSDEWKIDNAWFAAYFFNKNNGNSCWVQGEMLENDFVAFYLPAVTRAETDFTHVIFTRMNPNYLDENGVGVLDWSAEGETEDNKLLWSQTGDLTYPGYGYAYEINGWESEDNTGNWIDISSAVDRVEVAGGIVYANGVVAAEGAIEVYNVGGAIVARGNDNVDLRALNAGVYIVRNGNQVRKVVR